ncbi:hypothetical protein Tdes44962_MAKER08021 [Teratosphaeria destructans]|uniref:Uncharacterized protein n=1 Tax=Teratosphaeria destructans TaxID=418781 RepID=A0A9W7W5I6_9PEZI|nr:hypothetical protein Tdes44962_MAKER08021 [Teratosphaeria destructans]
MCIVFDQEEETDYTSGPSRFVNAFDGVAEVSALLMTLDFSRKVQAALQAQRAYEKADRRAMNKLDSLLRYESKIKCEITDYEYRISLLEPSDGSQATDEGRDGVVDQEKEQSLRRELEVLRQMLDDSKTQYEVLKYGLQGQADTLRQVQAEANAYLEAAFVHAHLLPPHDDATDIPVADLDIQEDYKKYASQTMAEVGEDAGLVVPLDTSRDHMYVPPPSDEEQAQQALKEAFWTARQQLQDARYVFDRWQGIREMELHEHKAAVAVGQPTVDSDRDAFDARWLQEVPRLTRQVIDAEEVVAETKAAALAAGINIATPDAASGFIDDVDDGYALSFEQELIVSAPVEKIYHWFDVMENVPRASVSELPEVPHIDDWNFRPVENSDSISMVFLGDERRRIDKWHVHRAGPLCRSASVASEGDSRRRAAKRRLLHMGVCEVGISGLPLLADDQRIFDRFWRFDEGPLLLVGAPISELL